MALILAYADITSTLVSDADGSPINVQSTSGVQTIDYYTAELRFSGRAFDRMDWTVGGFYYDGESVNNQVVSIPFLGFVAELPAVPVRRILATQFVNTDNVHENNNESVFAHVVFDVTDKFAVTAGVRYSNDEKVVAFDNTRVQVPRVVVEGRQHRLQARASTTSSRRTSSPTRAGRRVIGRAATTRVRSRPRRSSRSMRRTPRRTSSDSSRTGSTGASGPTSPCSTRTGRPASRRSAAPSASCSTRTTRDRRPSIYRTIRARRDPRSTASATSAKRSRPGPSTRTRRARSRASRSR